MADGALTYAQGDVEDCPARFGFDPNDFVLTSYQRIRGGLVTGDEALADRFRGLFFKI